MFGFLCRFYEKRFTAVLIASFALLTILAIHNRFVIDDAFISFRYSENLVNGKGLVWNEGEIVEGFTNFSWTLIMTVPFLLRMDPVIFSYVISISLSVLTLWLTFRLATLVLSSRNWGLLTALFLGTNYTFSSFATSGLETQLQACLFVACAYLVCARILAGNPRVRELLLLSVLMFAAVFTRLDSAVFVAVTGSFVLFHIIRQPGSGRFKGALALSLPVTVLTGGWLSWKWFYYADILPNTFHAKPASISIFGLKYFLSFLLTYWLLPLLLLGGIYGLRHLKKISMSVSFLLFVVVFWSAYVATVGDYMEFRMLVPILSLIFIFVAWIIREATHVPALRAGLVGLVIAGSFVHVYSFTGDINTYVKGHFFVTDPMHDLVDDIGKRKFVEVGKTLGDAFDYNYEVSIAVGPAGAIPFHSRLRYVDMHGLNDIDVANDYYYRYYSPVAGHTRMSTIEHLQYHQVNLVIGFPARLQGHDEAEPYLISELSHLSIKPPPGSRIIEIPIDRETTIAVLYLTQSPYVDAAIERNGWKTFEVRGDQELQEATFIT